MKDIEAGGEDRRNEVVGYQGEVTTIMEVSIA